MSKALLEITGKGGYWEGNAGGQTALPGRPHVLVVTPSVQAKIAKGFFKHISNLNDLATDEKYKAMHKLFGKDKKKTVEAFLEIYDEKVKVADAEKKEAAFASKAEKEVAADKEAAEKEAAKKEALETAETALKEADEKATAATEVVKSAEAALGTATAENKKELSDKLIAAKADEKAALKAAADAKKAYDKLAD